MAPRTVETSFTSVSWIPSEAMLGPMRLPMDVGLGHYDRPPPDRIDDVEALVSEGRCRFVNRLTAWATIEDGRIVDSGSSGAGRVAATEVDLKAFSIAIPAIGFPEIRSTEADGDRSVTFVQSAGGRTGAPFPRRVGKAGRPKLRSPTAWTTLSITIGADGSVSHEARGASPFPRHWFYGPDGAVESKSATIDFSDWTGRVHDRDTPWGDSDNPVLAASSESSLERMLSTMIMQGGAAPAIRELEAGDVLMAQGQPADSMGLVLDGLVEIEVDGRVVADCGPGSVLGERAFLEGGTRTATVRAVTKVKVAEAEPGTFGPHQLDELRSMHQRERD